MTKRKYYPVVKGWIDAGTALDKFSGFRTRKKGKIHRTFGAIRYLRRKCKRRKATATIR